MLHPYLVKSTTFPNDPISLIMMHDQNVLEDPGLASFALGQAHHADVKHGVARKRTPLVGKPLWEVLVASVEVEIEVCAVGLPE